MTEMYAQGDILIERVDDVSPSGQNITPDPGGVHVLARGEATGHRHAFYTPVVMFRDDALARDMPSELYVAHVKIDSASAELKHEEHDTINLSRGTYRVRRQREYNPDQSKQKVQLVAD